MAVEDKLCRAVRTMDAVRRSHRPKISGAKFARLMGRSENWWRKLMAGNRQPSYESLSRFCRRFHVDPRELFEEDW